jgi:hypothetical protein
MTKDVLVLHLQSLSLQLPASSPVRFLLSIKQIHDSTSMFGLEPPPKRPRLEQHYSSHSQSQCFDDTQPASTQPTAELQQEIGTRAATENDDDAQERQSHAPNPDQTYTSPRPQIQTPAPAPEPLTGPSPSTASLNGSWYQDGFSQDPGFLASQEELRAILFTLANSAAPTRASSPELGKTPTTTSPVVYQYQQPQYSRDQRRRSGRDVIPQSPLSSRRRIEYLKNYVAEIAPWVRFFLISTSINRRHLNRRC